MCEKGHKMGRNSKKRSQTQLSKESKAAIIVLEVAVLLTIVVIICAVLNGNIISTMEETTKYVLQSQTTTEESQSKSDSLIPDLFLTEQQNSPETTAGNDFSFSLDTPTQPPQKQPDVNAEADPSAWGKAEIVAKAAEAINKTKLYKNNLTVNHKETFNATVTECSGGSIVQSIANVMVGWVVKPTDETLNYNNGYTVNTEGETVPIILPKRGNFYLDAQGVTNASATRNGGNYILRISLVSESVGMGQVPTHNAGAIGYLDTNSFDISFMQVDRADIIYSGSSIELHINGDGYVTYAAYKVPMTINGAAHRGSISGSATFVGEQTETWILNY